MTDPYTQSFARLAEGLRLEGVAEGNRATRCEAVRCFAATAPVSRAPITVGTGLVIIGQGTKTGYLGDRSFTYDRRHFLVVGAKTPYDCSTAASDASALLGIFIDLEAPLAGPGFSLLSELANLAAQLEEPQRVRSEAMVGAARIDPAMERAVIRLNEALLSDTDAQILAPGLLRECLYRALFCPGSDALWDLARPDSERARIAEVLRQVRQRLHEKHSVPQLAQAAKMSEPSFYRAFRRVMGDSPAAFINKLRLHEGHALIAFDGLRVKEVAQRVGYDSSAQFSRDYRRHFGAPPSAARSHNLGAPPQKPRPRQPGPG